MTNKEKNEKRKPKTEKAKEDSSAKVKVAKEGANFKDSLNSKNVDELRLELSKVKMDVLAGKEKNTSLIKVIKKEIAKKLSKR